MGRTEQKGDFDKWDGRAPGAKLGRSEASQGELVAAFLARIARLEMRYAHDPYATKWMVSKAELLAVRDMIEKPGLFDL